MIITNMLCDCIRRINTYSRLRANRNSRNHPPLKICRIIPPLTTRSSPNGSDHAPPASIKTSLLHAAPNRISGLLLRGPRPKPEPGPPPGMDRRAWTTYATAAAASRVAPTAPHTTPATSSATLVRFLLADRSGPGGATRQGGSVEFRASGSATVGRPWKKAAISRDAGPGSFWYSSPCSDGRMSRDSDRTAQIARRQELTATTKHGRLIPRHRFTAISISFPDLLLFPILCNLIIFNRKKYSKKTSFSEHF